jgi:hypothetical protein
MLAVFIAVSCAVAVGVCCSVFAGLGIAWCLTWGVLTFVLIQISIGLVVRKKVMIISNKIQEVLLEGQKKINRKIQMFQRKPQGGLKQMQKILEKDQAEFIKEALETVEQLAPYCKWNFLISKQMNSMRMQFNFQLKKFDKVDELLNKALYSEPMAVAMKMTRQYHNEDPKLEKTFNKYRKKFKGEQSVLLYALYAWILIKQDKVDEALKLLSAGKEETGNDVLEQNWKNVANGKIKKFSNAGLGEQWYALYLEEPKQPKARQQRAMF